MSLHFEKVAGGRGFPEGPVAMNDGSVLFVEIEAQRVSRLAADGAISTVAEVPGGPNGLAIGPDGAAYICNNGGVYSFVRGGFPGVPGEITMPSPEPNPEHEGGLIQRLDLTTGELTTLYDRCGDDRLIAPDDLVFDKEGGFYFTDSGKHSPGRLLEGGLYYATIDGTSITRLASIPTANGVGLAPGGATLYVSDTLFGRLWKLEVTGKGAVRGGIPPIVPADVVQTLPDLQWVDSLKVEAGGRICVGTLLTGRVTVFGPDDATEPVPIPVGDPLITNLCFGGADMRDVWITASGTGAIYKTRWERPGLKLNFDA